MQGFNLTDKHVFLVPFKHVLLKAMQSVTVYKRTKKLTPYALHSRASSSEKHFTRLVFLLVLQECCAERIP